MQMSAGQTITGDFLIRTREDDMILTEREFWVAVHGIVFGAVFLLAYSGVLFEIYRFRPDWVTGTGMAKSLRFSKIGTAVMALVAWLTVITGTYIAYPWYRAKPPEGSVELLDYPRYYLLSKPGISFWHTFGMEWKEHVAWFAPILATAVAFIVWHAGFQIAASSKLRNALMILLTLAFASAAVAGLFGAFITKAAPVM
jgi:hypothetical protein